MTQPHACRAIDTFRATTAGLPCHLHVVENRNIDSWKHAEEINRYLRMCAGGYLLILDDDVWFEDNGWLQAAITILDAHPDVGIVAPAAWWNERENRKQYAHVDRPLYMDWVGSCCAIYRAVDFVHRWLEYEHYYGDPDYCLCCWEYGLRTVAIPERIFHVSARGETSSIRAVLGERKRADMMRRDKVRYQNKWADRLPAIQARVEILNKECPL